mmetsp:Transcript_4350/g.10409  ORF Transcript_4350/g.10409 Transcript_4350/m.10409 type:complete len:200 (-) Transcript_4350:125-724(-)
MGKRLSGLALSLSNNGGPTTLSQSSAVMPSRMDRHSFMSPRVATGSSFTVIVKKSSQSVVAANTRAGIPRENSLALAMSENISAAWSPSCPLHSWTIFPLEHFLSMVHRPRHSCLRSSPSSVSCTIATPYNLAILWLANFPAHLMPPRLISALRFSASSDSRSIAFSTSSSRSSSEIPSGRDDARSVIKSMKPPLLSVD